MAELLWSNDIDSDFNDPEIQKDEYENYLERFSDMDGDPLPFEDWLENDFYQDYDLAQIWYEQAESEFDYVIVPILERETDNKLCGMHSPIFLIGNRSGWRAGSGGLVWEDIDEFSNWCLHRDYENTTNISSDNGILVVRSYDHDGSTGGTLYTIPDDESSLVDMLRNATTYPDEIDDYRDEYDASLTDDQILIEMFLDDIRAGWIDWRGFIKYPEYLKPIKDN